MIAVNVLLVPADVLLIFIPEFQQTDDSTTVLGLLAIGGINNIHVLGVINK